MIYDFPAILSLPACLDTHDTIPVPITATVDEAFGDVPSYEFDAVVTADTPGEGYLTYRRDQVISHEDFTADNHNQLIRAYAISREVDALI